MTLAQDNDHAPRTFIGYTGPSVWTIVGNHFGPRLAEWSGSATMVIMGVILLGRDDVFDQSTMIYFKAVFGTQVLLGVLLFLFGFLGLLGLTVNGMRKEVTPWVRYSRAMVGFLVFTGMSTCFALSGIFTLWAAWYPVAAACELVNMFRTSKDAGESYVAK